MSDDDNSRLWRIVLDLVTNDGKMIGWGRSQAEVWADTEAEARQIAAEEWPELTIYSIKDVTDEP